MGVSARIAGPDAAVLQVFGRETMAAAQAAEAPLCVVLLVPFALALSGLLVCGCRR